MKIFCVLVLIAAGTFSAFAQEKMIDPSEFEAVVMPAAENVGKYFLGKPLRLTMSSEVRNSARPEFDFTSKMLSERSSNGDYHGLSESTFGGKPMSEETIRIGEARYRRANGGKWERSPAVKETQTAPPAPRPSPTEQISSEIEYKYLGTENYKGETAGIYSKVERSVDVNKSTGKEQRSVKSSKYWLAKDGHLLRQELRTTTKMSDATSNINIVTEYGADPAITITAPEVP